MKTILPVACFATISLALFLPCHAGKIHDAVTKHDLAALDKALRQEPKQVNARCYPDFDTPLYIAVAEGDPAIVKRLLDAGADAAMPSAGPGRLTPTQRAVTMTREEGMGELPEVSADPAVAGGGVPSKENGTPTATDQPLPARPFPPLPADEKQARMRVIELLLASKPATRNDGPNGVSPLHIAAGLVDADVVKLLVTSGADVNARCPAWMTPLHYATLRNTDCSVLDLLLAKGADVDAADKFGRTPLMFAARMGNAKGVETLIAAGAALDAEDIHRQSVICHAAGGGNDAIVKLIYQKGGRDLIRIAKPEALSRIAAASGSVALLEILLAEGLDVNIRDEAGFTPLLTALERDRREVTAFLLSKGADRNAKTQDGLGMIEIACLAGNTPLVKEFVAAQKVDELPPFLLSYAAERGRLEIVKLLIENGVDVNAPGPKGHPPLMAALAGDSVALLAPDPNPPSEDDRAEIVELLIGKGAKADGEPYRGSPWIHAAVHFRGVRVVKALLKAGVQADLRAGPYRNTPLLVAVQAGRAETVRLLLDAGANPQTLNVQEDGLLHIAAGGGHVEVVRLLIDKHFPVNAKNSVNGGTPLHHAALANSLECVKLLLAEGASPNSQDSKGITPLLWAIDMSLNRPPQKSKGTDDGGNLQMMAGNLRDRLGVIHLLLEGGARTDGIFRDAKENEPRTFIEYARRNGTPEIVELLENPPSPKPHKSRKP